MTPHQEYWLSLFFIIIASFGAGVILGTEMMARKAIEIIDKNFGTKK